MFDIFLYSNISLNSGSEPSYYVNVFLMLDIVKLDFLVNKIASRFNPDKIILFGSYATSHPNQHSDLDLLIIQDTTLPIHRRGFEIQKYLVESMIPIDILVYTASEYEQSQKEKSSFLFSAIKTSRVLYERNQ